MIGIKSRKDAVVTVLLLVFFLGFLYLVFFISGWWLLSAPFYGLLALFISIWAGTGKAPEMPKNEKDEEEGTTISTQLLTVGGELKPCTVILQTDRLLVKARNIYTPIPMHSMSTLMFEDKTTDGLPMAGFGVDYLDSQGSARVMFFNEGMFSVGRTRKIVSSIQTAHRVWQQTHECNDLSMIDVTAIKNSAVHRLP